MNIMPVREGLFKVVTALYQTTGIPLLKYAGLKIVPLESGFGGEAGVFYFVPLVATFFGVSSTTAAYYFFTFLTAISAILAGSALVYYAKTYLGKGIALVAIALFSYVVWQVGDVYIGYFFAVSFFPWFLILLEKNYKVAVGYCLVMGIMLEYANFIRSYAALPVFVAVSCVCFIFFRQNFKKSIMPLGALILGILFVRTHFNSVIKQRDDFLLQQHQTITQKDSLNHTFWHGIYAGMGFIDNDKNLKFADSCPHKKVQSINKQVKYLTEEYEALLRAEVFSLCFRNPHYVLRVLFAKLGVLFYFLLLFANVGLLAAYWYPKPLYVELGYWILMAVSALPGVLTIPITTYLLGFISACVLYGVHSILYALNKRSRFL